MVWRVEVGREKFFQNAILLVCASWAAVFEQSSDSIQTYENEPFVYSLENELTGLAPSYQVRLFASADVFLFDQQYRDDGTGKVFPAIRLREPDNNAIGSRLDKEQICNDFNRQCFVTVKVRIRSAQFSTGVVARIES